MPPATGLRARQASGSRAVTAGQRDGADGRGGGDRRLRSPRTARSSRCWCAAARRAAVEPGRERAILCRRPSRSLSGSSPSSTNSGIAVRPFSDSVPRRSTRSARRTRCQRRSCRRQAHAEHHRAIGSPSSLRSTMTTRRARRSFRRSPAPSLRSADQHVLHGRRHSRALDVGELVLQFLPSRRAGVLAVDARATPAQAEARSAEPTATSANTASTTNHTDCSQRSSIARGLRGAVHHRSGRQRVPGEHRRRHCPVAASTER